MGIGEKDEGEMVGEEDDFLFPSFAFLFFLEAVCDEKENKAEDALP
tara:strand:+ start:546 stop:683 length:138 start_codon:yes stop_codon:yes gene_type:complete